MKHLSSSIIVVLFAAFVVTGVVFAFTAPTTTPPGGNVDPPLNVTFQAQEKLGGLILGTGTPWTAPNGLIVAQGNVGIGTTNPTSILNIVGSNADVRHYSYDDCELCGADYEFMRARGIEGSPDPVVGFGGENDKLGSIRFKGWDGTDFFTGAEIIARASGSVGTVVGDVAGRLEFLTRANTTSVGDPLEPLEVRLTIIDTGEVGIGTESPGFVLDVAGSAHASAFPVSSDARFKENITQLTGVLDKLQNIRGVSFDWNDLYSSLGRATEGKQIGVIAQELEKEFPELVSTWGGDSDYRAVEYGRFTAVLLEAIKEQQAQIEQLRVELDELRTQIK